ncbi:uncharacterized protein LOC128230905 [Mya arenaria]|uniref:uncharacterized protein LOC128230905 n=1 Tax=Mya arenaria TaxID=6604 RepID=UPI0022E78A16|nr:uncharacterized protein LOC128230905 [Mya arenaria]
MVGVLSAAVALVFLWASVVGGMEDGTLESRFEYEYKVLQKLIMLEMEKTELRGMVAALKTRLEEAETVIHALNATVRNVATGSTYIRWGRKTCPTETGARPLYDGYAGGTLYSHTGGGNTYLCLPRDPVLNDIQGGERSGIYGAKYHTSGTIWSERYNGEVPSVICIKTNTNVVMVPAKNVCHPGWTLDYAGYLMAETSVHNAKIYVCMDGEPDGLD